MRAASTAAPEPRTHSHADVLRVLFVSHSFPPTGRPMANWGGMQRVATELAAALEAHPQAEVIPVVLRTSWAMTHVRVAPFIAGLVARIPRQVHTHRIDVVLFASMVTAGAAVALRPKLRRLGVPTAGITHGLDMTYALWGYQWWIPRVLNALDLVLPGSRAVRDACLERGAQPDRLQVVPNGVRAEWFAADTVSEAERATSRARLDPQGVLPERAFLLCSVGRHIERKGVAWFVREVMPRLPDDVHYWSAGNGPATRQIEREITATGLQHRVRLLGALSDDALEMLYRSADLMVMPNIPVRGEVEGFGVVILEAGMCGLPTLAADLEGIRDVVEEGENGFLAPPGDADRFAQRITDGLNDPAMLRDARDRAAGYTRSRFAWPVVADRYVEVLRTLAESGRKASQQDGAA